MVARFFVDENDLALGKALAALHGDVVYPGHPELPEVPRQTEDDVWLEVVGRRRLVVITRDKKIRYRPVERQAVGHAPSPGIRADWTQQPSNYGQPLDPPDALDLDQRHGGREPSRSLDVCRHQRSATTCTSRLTARSGRFVCRLDSRAIPSGSKRSEMPLSDEFPDIAPKCDYALPNWRQPRWCHE